MTGKARTSPTVLYAGTTVMAFNRKCRAADDM
jgi:hypothetical protein